MCRISGRTYRPDGGSHCCVNVRGIFCKNVYPLYEGCVCVCPNLSESSSNRRTARQRKMGLQSVGQWICSYVCLSTCRCEVLAFLVYIFDVSLLGPAFCSPLVVSIRLRMFGMSPLGSGLPEGASIRTQLHSIWSPQ